MQSETKPARTVVNEHKAAAALDMSVHTLRKDRIKDRRIPFFKIGGAIRYDLNRVREALEAYECGGPAPQTANRRK